MFKNYNKKTCLKIDMSVPKYIQLTLITICG